jgi:hypothetical protein
MLPNHPDPDASRDRPVPVRPPIGAAGRVTGAVVAVALALVAGLSFSVAPATARPGPLIDSGPMRLRTITLVQDPVHQTEFTAYTLFDVGPTPYWISIWDHTTHALLGFCGTGTECNAHAVWPGQFNEFHEIVAYRGGFPSSDPPAGPLSTSNSIWIGTHLG